MVFSPYSLLENILFLSGGLTSGNVKKAIRYFNPDWVDVSSVVLGAASKAVNNATLEEIQFVDTDMVALKYMIKTVTISGGSDTNACDVYIVKA